MQNIIEILKGLNVTLTDEQTAELNKAVASNYKTVAEFDKKVARLEAERDGFKEQMETAQTALKGFEGVDVEQMNRQLNEYKTKAEKAEAAYNKRLQERDFDDALKSAFEGYKFTSAAAKAAILAEVKSKGLTMADGKIVGLSDVMAGIKERDKDAFADETPAAPAAQFTAPIAGATAGKTYTSKEEIMKIRDASERQQAIRDNINLFVR
ncbi:MAG: phage scaffolding protein [Kiritimatiellae bacterium]|nr:phage scaffolding protein [Kiritimatiellia bacterium]